jgi:LmbE family N-acetylglucosaminyl deacetylase
MDTMPHRGGANRLGLLRTAVVIAMTASLALLVSLSGTASAATAGCPNGATMAVVAHEDDSILFLSPDLLHDITTGRCVRTVFVTAGDDGQGATYWQSREKGAEAAYANMAGVANTWTQTDAGIAGHPMPVFTLSGNSKVSLVFMRLPDGNEDGSGFPSTGNTSIQQLYQGQISSITTVDKTSSYTESQLISTLTSMMSAFTPDRVDTQDYVGTFGDGDHSDHHTVAYLTRLASRSYTAVTHTLASYQDYANSSEPQNVTGTDFTAKQNAWFAYAPLDNQVCQTVASCKSQSTWAWLETQYPLTTETDGPGHTFPPTANAGVNQTVNESSTVQLDGSGSIDSGGAPSYQWTQTAGPAATLSSSTAVKPTFTAPSTPANLTFQLVVTDGSFSSSPATVTVSVTPQDVARLATATASSQNTSTGQTAAKAIDGVIDGYPGDSTKEWATNGGRVNSTLTLTWTSAQTINEVVLYDRPNTSDQITAGTLTFSDGSTVAVPSLNNDGTATMITFPAKTTTSLKLTVTKVSASTQNVGLAEIQVFPAGSTGSTPPSANAGADQAVATGAVVQLDGSGSFDPNGSPTYSWTQTAGPAVTLSSSSAVKPTFTAPGTAGTLTFQLVVSDGTLVSQPSTVTITVNATNPNIAPNATVTASSQNTSTSQLATNAVDGIIDGYPGDYTKEWATVGGGAGSWLNLAWSGPQTINEVVLYDRPNLNDQITGGTLTFSDGSTVTVPSLNNGGTATTITFPAKTTTSLKLTITTVSATTQNIGLAEIQVYPASAS